MTEAQAKLMALATVYGRMPNGGAPLMVTVNGEVHNGVVIICYFPDRKAAWSALIDAGFSCDDERERWKIRGEET
jgi:hypothetical protein